MAISTVKQLSEQTGQLSATPGGDFFDVKYSVTLTERSETAGRDVCVAVDPVTGVYIPQPGTQYGTTYLRVLTVTPNINGQSGLNWIVTVHYGIDASFVSSDTAPWLRKPLVSFKSVRYPYVLEYDYSAWPAQGVPLQNSARDKFDPPVMTELKNTIMVIRWARQCSTYDLEEIANTLTDTVNDDAVTIRGKSYLAHNLLLRDISGNETLWNDGTRFWDLTLEIEMERTVPIYQIKVPDRGYRQLVDGTPKLIMVEDPDDPTNKLPTPIPVNLDGTGAVLSPSGIDLTHDLTFVVHPEADWTALQLT